MLFAGPQLTSVRPPRLIEVPASVVVAYDGTIASLAAYPAWALCDGTGGTPDLSDRFVIGADDASYLKGNTGGSQAGQVAGTTSSDGGHGNIGGLLGNSGGSNYKRGIGGVHAHALTGDLDPWMPPSRRLAFIMATVPATLPPNAVCWAFDVAAPDGFSAFAALEDRFALGTTSDDRTQLGADSRTATMSSAASGDHTHPTSSYKSGAEGYGHPNASSGGHTHAAFTETLSVPKPPYLVLLAVAAPEEAGAVPKLVVAWDGALVDLPAEWLVCDGLGGTPDLRGRMPAGASAALAVGETGGQSGAAPISGGAVPSATVTHHHDAGAPAGSNLSDHSSYAWTHGHASWSGEVDPMPPFHVLRYIMFTG